MFVLLGSLRTGTLHIGHMIKPGVVGDSFVVTVERFLDKLGRIVSRLGHLVEFE